MRRFFGMAIAVILGTVLIFLALSEDFRTMVTRELRMPQQIEKLNSIPLAYWADDNQPSNFMCPYYNERDVFLLDNTQAVWTQNEQLELVIQEENTKAIQYDIIDPLSKKAVNTLIISPENIKSEEGKTVVKLGIPMLDKGKKYVINIKCIIQEKDINYYQAFTINSSNHNLPIAKAVELHNMLFNKNESYNQLISGANEGGVFYYVDNNSSQDALLWNTKPDIVKMNEPIPELVSYNPIENTFNIRLKFTVALRKNYDFEYWDFSENYIIKESNGALNIIDYSREGNRKSMPYFREESQQWVLDEGAYKNEAKTITSPNGRYVAAVYNNRIWLLDKNYNELKKVFAFDNPDGDYFRDESKEFGIKILNTDDKGNIDYLVYGHMASGDFAGYNGILFSNFNNRRMNNEAQAFLSLPNDFKELSYYIEKVSYYSNKRQELFLGIRSNLYALELGKNRFSRIAELPDKYVLSKEGLLYSNNSENKENVAISLYDLEADSVKKNELVLQKTNIRPIGAIDEGLIFGSYTLGNTYEYLNGEVVFPYDKIYICNREGEINQIAEAGSGLFYKEIEIKKEEGGVWGKTTQLFRYGNKLRYDSLDERMLYTFDARQEGENEEIAAEEITGGNIIRFHHSTTALDETNIPTSTYSHKKYVMVEGRLEADESLYEVYSDKGLSGVARTLGNSLEISAESNSSKVYFFEKGQRNNIYDVNIQIKNRIIDVKSISQKPELARGCEVTSLAMLLSHAKKQTVDKMVLAEQIAKDESQRTVVNGIIYYGDMHKGFVGSISDRSKPGLGVYAKPIFELGKKYVSNIHNISGASFEQILGFVGNQEPVWVITPINYNVVPESVIQVWKTNSGFMETTFLEHSVVIVGYDDKNVYFNDPIQGKRLSKPLAEFKKGWENQGRQAIVVLKN